MRKQRQMNEDRQMEEEDRMRKQRQINEERDR